MSRFFQSSSDSDTESESDNEIQVQQKQVARYAFSDDEDQKTTKKQVLPEAIKRSQEINSLVRQLKNAKKIRDVVKSSELFEDLAKAYEKCKKIVEKSGHFKQYIRCLAEFEQFINDLWADNAWRQSTSNNNNVALKRVRQRIKKYYKDFEGELEEFKKHPENYPEEDKQAEGGDSEDGSLGDSDRSSESSLSDDESKKPVKQPKQAKKQPSDDESGDDDKSEGEDDSEWSSSEESSDDSSLDLEGEDIWKQFLKKPEDQKAEKTKKEENIEKEKKRRKRAEAEIAATARDDDQDSVTTSKQDGTATQERPKLFPKDEEITCEKALAKLNEICALRGRKGGDRREQMEQMIELKEIVRQINLGQALEVKILFNHIAVNFDYNPNLNKCMNTDSWSRCIKMVEELIGILRKNDEIQVGEQIADDSESFSQAPFRVRGDALSVIDRMSEEFVKILQQCDAHGSEYVDRLKDEPKVCALIDALQEYLESKGSPQELCRVYLKKIENLYYKYDDNNQLKSADLMERLCKYIYSMDNTDRIRTKAMLCHIYHHALHNRWFEARDLMLMSHLQESIDHSDIPLQILYNRTMVQVGLCAFRVGNVREAHAALLDIQSANRAKELLAQGMMTQRNVEKSKEQETKERQRLIPFHMHINLELLECVYLVSAMLIEIPYMSSRDYETKKRMISKQFHYQLKFSERQPVVGPPENMREHVVAASRAMRNGDWRACVNFLINEKMNAKVWNLIPQSSNVKIILTEKVKEETMRTYLFKYSSVYESLSILTLADMFELPKSQVYSIISKMIINEDLMASLDEPTETIIMHRTEPTRLQTLALQLSEKISTLMDHTERMMQFKGGEMGALFGRNQQGQQNQQNQQNQQTKYFNQQQNWNKQNQNKNRQQKQHQLKQHQQQQQAQQQY